MAPRWPSTALGGARRLRDSIELLVRLQEVRHASGGAPEPARLEQVQRLARRMGGLPAVVAEIMSAYTGHPTPTGFDDPRSTTATGAQRRPVQPTNVDLTGLDLALCRIAVPVVTRRSGRARLGVDTLEQLAADTRTQAQLDDRHRRAVADRLEEVLGEVGRVHTGDDGAIVLVTHGEPVQVLDALTRLALDHGVVHARIRSSITVDGAATEDGTATEHGRAWSVARWGTARRVSPEVIEVLRGLMNQSDAGATRDGAAEPGHVDRQDSDEHHGGTTLIQGLLDDGLIDDLGPIVAEILDPLASLPGHRERNVRERTFTDAGDDGLQAVPDELGLVYLAAHLTAVAGLTSALVRPPRGDPSGSDPMAD